MILLFFCFCCSLFTYYVLLVEPQDSREVRCLEKFCILREGKWIQLDKYMYYDQQTLNIYL